MKKLGDYFREKGIMEWIPEGSVGCVLTCGPYAVLARKAVPGEGPASNLLKMTISEWEEVVGCKK